MDTRIKQIAIGIIAVLLLNGCAYDLDLKGFLGTSEAVNHRFQSSMEWTVLNQEYEITVDSTAYTFLVGGDSHVGTIINIEKMLQIAVAQGALAVSVAGDVTTGREEGLIRTDSLFRKYPEVAKFIIPGNHDLYFNAWERYFELFGPSVYTLRVISGEEADLFVFLDTGSGTVGLEQFTWLESLLEEESESYRNIIIITHLNFFRNRMTGSTNPLNEEVMTLLDLFAEHSIQLVIQGHDHKRYITEFGETTYLTLDALKDGVKNASYLELRINEENISTVFHEF